MAGRHAIWQQSPAPIPPASFNLARHALCPSTAGSDSDILLEIVTSAAEAPEAFTRADLQNAVMATMTGLAARGLRPGDRCFVCLGNSLDFPIAFFAASGMGALPVPVSPMATLRELQVMHETLSPRLTIAENDRELPSSATRLPLAEFRQMRGERPSEFAETCANDPAYIVFTSGTGGRPKAVVHAHRAAFARRMMWQDWYGLRAGDRMLHAGAFNWTYTLGAGLMDPWAIGATALIYTGRQYPGVWADLAERFSPTLFAAAPGVYRQILKPDVFRPEAFRTLRHGLAAGEAMPNSIRVIWETETGLPLLEALGMSEVSTYISQSPEQPELYRPQTGRSVAILEDDTARPTAWDMPGRLAVSKEDPGLMLGYWQDGKPSLPSQNGWFITGDRAAMREDGHITYLGRGDALLTTGGYRIAPAEVEAVLTSHPAVAEACVLSLPVRADVSVLAAFLVPHFTIADEDLSRHCAQMLARYKQPRKFVFLDALPRTARGKVDRHALMEAHGWKEPA
ncbi:class I adenylate-forming enzyme family protein [Algicella marina]|nr:class I adenylate-forming enzyme family protein [Algicella marina]